MKVVVALCALATLGTASPHPDDPFVGRIKVRTAACIGRFDQANMRIIDERTIVYFAAARRLWRNDLPDRCPGLDRDPLLVVEQFGSQLCEHDRIRLIERGSHIPGPYCRLGRFSAWDKPPTGRTD